VSTSSLGDSTRLAALTVDSYGKLQISECIAVNMKAIRNKFSYLPLMLVLLWIGQCESLIDSSVPEIFFPFGTDEGDTVVTFGSNKCDGPISIPYTIFRYTTLYVSSTC